MTSIVKWFNLIRLSFKRPLWLVALIVLAIMIFVNVLLSIFVFEDHAYDNEYILDMMAETGLLKFKKSFCIEKKLIENQWVDAAVFLKLKVDTSCMNEIKATIKCYPKFNSGISGISFPLWWQPGSSAIRVVYYINEISASPITLSYIDDCESCIYLAIIPH